MKSSKNEIKRFRKEFELLQTIVEDNCDGLVMAKSRQRKHVVARMAFANILLKNGYTSTDVGAFMGKDHATVLHYKREFDGLCRSDRQLKVAHEKSLEIFDSFPRNTEYKKSHKEELREVIKKLEVSEAELKSQINILNLRLESEQHKDERLKNIIDIVKDRTREGTEWLVEEKIKRFYNGVYDR